MGKDEFGGPSESLTQQVVVWSRAAAVNDVQRGQVQVTLPQENEWHLMIWELQERGLSRMTYVLVQGAR